MKKYLLIIIIIIISSISINAAEGWRRIETGRYIDLRSVCFVDKMNGWACGGNIAAGINSIIIHTTDGGETWTLQDSGSSFTLYKIQFMDKDTGWACGSLRAFMKTTDGGKNWRKINISQNIYPLDMDFVNHKTGYLSLELGDFAKTTDGGESWKLMDYKTKPVANIRSISFIDTLRGWACGLGGHLLNTTDGGETWQDRIVFGLTLEPRLNDIMALDSNYVFYTGQDQFVRFRIQNKGGWYDYYGDDSTKSRDFYSIFMHTPSIGWVVGDYGYIGNISIKRDYTTNAILGVTLYDVFFIDSLNGWTVGVDGVVFKTTTGGVASIDYNINENNEEQKVILYPNPLNNVLPLNIKFEEDVSTAKISVYSSIGEMKITEQDYPVMNNSIIYSQFSELTNGMYYVNITINGYKKIVLPVVIYK